MKKFLHIFAIGVLAFSASQVSANTKKPAKPAAKPIDLKYCPIALGEAKPSKSSVKYKNYNVHFCCPGCDTAFKGLSNAEKDKKVAAVLKKQAPAKKS
jgi:hypothetical protein